jgi:hypothetical protein
VLNWGDYIDPNCCASLKTNRHLHQIHHYDQQRGNARQARLCGNIYDVCFPSDYLIEKLIGDDPSYPNNKANIRI